MNILQITPNYLSKRCNNNFNNQVKISNYNLNSYASYPNLKPLSSDVVSFGSKDSIVRKTAQKGQEVVSGLRQDKIVDEKSYFYEMPSLIAKALVNDAAVSMAYFEKIMNKNFGHLISKKSDKPLQDMYFRTKTWKSTEDKLKSVASKLKAEAEAKGETFEVRNKQEAKVLIEDINAGRLIIRDKSKMTVNKIFDIFTKMLKQGEFKEIKQIENYCPQIGSADNIPYYVLRNWEKDFGWKFSDKQLRAMSNPEYFSYAKFNDLENYAKRWGLNINDKNQFKIESRKNGYPAIHVTVVFPDDSVGEIQIMCRDEEFFKEWLEDGRYKTLCNKTKGMYKPLVDRWKKIKSIPNMIDEHQQYTFWANITQLLKSTQPFDSRVSTKILRASDKIRQHDLGYNQVIFLAREAKKSDNLKK